MSFQPAGYPTHGQQPYDQNQHLNPYGGGQYDEDEEDIDFNAIAVGQKKPLKNGGRVPASRAQQNQNFVGNQQTSAYDVSQMSTQSHSQAPIYSVHSKTNFQKRLSPTQMSAFPSQYPPNSNIGASSPMTFGNSPNTDQFKNQNLAQQQKFKRQPIYAQIKVDIGQEQLRRIDEEPESMLQTPYSQMNQNQHRPSPEITKLNNQPIIEIPNDLIDSTPRIASIENMQQQEARRTPQAFDQLPDLEEPELNPISDAFTAQLATVKDDIAPNFSRNKKSIQPHSQHSNQMINEQLAYNNSFTKGVQQQNITQTSLRPNRDYQDTAEKESTAMQRIESTQQSFQVSRNYGNNGPMPSRSPKTQLPATHPENFYAPAPILETQEPSHASPGGSSQPMVKGKAPMSSIQHLATTRTKATTLQSSQHISTQQHYMSKQSHNLSTHQPSQQQHHPNQFINQPDPAYQMMAPPQTQHEFQSIDNRNAGKKPFMRHVPMNEAAIQKMPGGDDDSEENSFMEMEQMAIEDNRVIVQGTLEGPRRQQYLSQQEKVSDHMFNQSSIENRSGKLLDITEENMNNYFPPQPKEKPFQGLVRPNMITEPSRRQPMIQQPIQPKPYTKKKTSLQRKEKGISHNKMYHHLYKNLVPNMMNQAHRISNPENAKKLTVPRSYMPVSQTVNSPYENYVDKMNRYLDKNDMNLQNDLIFKNQNFLERNNAIHQEYIQANQVRVQHKMVEEMYNELEGCSFKPMINKNSNKIALKKRNPQTSDVDIPDEFQRSKNLNTAPESYRSADDFYKQEVKFVERHERWREEKIRNDIKQVNRGTKQKKISKKSEKIWENSQKRQSQVQGSSVSNTRLGFGLGQSISQGGLGSGVSGRIGSGVSISQGRLASSIGTSPESKLGFQGPFSDNLGDRNRVGSITSNRSMKSTRSIKNFLNRNYHTIGDQKKIVMMKASERAEFESCKERAIETEKYRTLKSPPPAESVRSRGSSKGSVNTRRQYKDKSFRPTLSDRSKQLSLNRTRSSNVFSALHGEKKDVIEQRKKLEQDDIMKYKNMARQKILRNVNETSACKLAEQFEKEFTDIYLNQLNQGNSIYLIDILEDLKFLDHEEVSKSFSKIEGLLQNGKQVLIIDLDQNRQNQLSIKMNLLEVCLAIQNLSNNYKQHPQLEDQVINKQMNKLKKQALHVQPEQMLIEQIGVLKDLVVRPAYNLSSRQINHIAQIFSEFNRTRRNLTFEEKRLGRYQKAVEVEMAKYQDVPSIHYTIKTEPNESKTKSNQHLKVEQTTRGRNKAQGLHTRSLSKASSNSSKSRYNSDKLFLHAQRQKEYKQELKEWYDKKERLQEQENLLFCPQLNQKTIKLAQKRNTNVIEHAKEYAQKQKVDLDSNMADYIKNRKECTFKPNTGRVQPRKGSMGRKNLNEIWNPSAEIKSKKTSSGITASTNFGSGISGTEPDNSTGWPIKRQEPKDQEIRISPELKVQASKNTTKEVPKQKSNPMTKYISANNLDDFEDNFDMPQSSKSNSVQEFLDLAPEQRKSKPGVKPPDNVQSLGDVLEKSGGGPRQLFTPKTLLTDDLNKSPSNLLKPPPKSVLSTRHPPKKPNLFSYRSMLPTVEEPICVLKIELDGRNIEEIKVFENDNPQVIVQEFGQKFNLSQNAMSRLLDQIHDQIQMDENSFT